MSRLGRPRPVAVARIHEDRYQSERLFNIVVHRRHLVRRAAAGPHHHMLHAQVARGEDVRFKLIFDKQVDLQRHGRRRRCRDRERRGAALGHRPTGRDRNPRARINTPIVVLDHDRGGAGGTDLVAIEARMHNRCGDRTVRLLNVVVGGRGAVEYRRAPLRDALAVTSERRGHAANPIEPDLPNRHCRRWRGIQVQEEPGILALGHFRGQGSNGEGPLVPRVVVPDPHLVLRLHRPVATPRGGVGQVRGPVGAQSVVLTYAHRHRLRLGPVHRRETQRGLVQTDRSSRRGRSTRAHRYGPCRLCRQLYRVARAVALGHLQR